MSSQPSDGVGLCKELNEIYESLKSDDPFRLLVDEMSDQLLENYLSGNQITKDRIPDYYSRKYGVNNLYRYRMRRGFRGIYTILIMDDETFCWILDLLNHDQYDHRFGYS